MSAASEAPIDVKSIIRTKGYVGLLLLSGGIGFVVALAAWCVLTLLKYGG